MDGELPHLLCRSTGHGRLLHALHNRGRRARIPGDWTEGGLPKGQWRRGATGREPCAFGDAGCVTTSDPELAERVRRLRNHGSSRRYYHQEMGGNSRMDAIQGAVLRIKLRHLDEWNARRREIAARYDQLFSAAALAGSPGCPVRPQTVYPQAQQRRHLRPGMRADPAIDLASNSDPTIRRTR